MPSFQETYCIGPLYYPVIYAQMDALSRLAFVIRVISSFLLMAVMTVMLILTPFHGNLLTAYGIMYSLVQLFTLLFLPLSFWIPRKHYDDPEAIILEEKKRLVSRIADSTVWITLVAGLFCVFGQDNKYFLQIQPLLFYTVYVYVVLELLYVFFPVWFFALICICFPVLWLIARYFGVQEQERARAMGATQDLIDTFPSFKFRKKVTVEVPPPPIDTSDSHVSSQQPSQKTPNTMDLEKGDLAKATIISATLSSPKESVSSPKATSPKDKRKKKRRYRFFRRDDTQGSADTVEGESSKPQDSEYLEVDDEHAQCGICLEDYNEDVVLKRLPCLHHFHAACIDDWLRVNAKCPFCVQNLKQDDKT